MKSNKIYALPDLLALPRNTVFYVEESPASNYAGCYASRTEFQGKPTIHFNDRTRVDLDDGWDKKPGSVYPIVRRAWMRKPDKHDLAANSWPVAEQEAMK